MSEIYGFETCKIEAYIYRLQIKYYTKGIPLQKEVIKKCHFLNASYSCVKL